MRLPRLLCIVHALNTNVDSAIKGQSMKIIIKAIKYLAVLPMTMALQANSDVYIKDGELFYIGKVSDVTAFAKLKMLYKEQDEMPTLLNVTSSGGDITPSIAFAKWIFEHDLNIKVTDYCYSSCANYIFPAGNIKFLTKHAGLIFHGGAESADSTPDSEYVESPEITKQIESLPLDKQQAARDSIKKQA